MVAGKAMSKYVTVPVVAGFALAVHSAIEFNKQMTFLQTQTGASAAEVRNMSAALVAMKGMQYTPVELSKGLYYIESAGIRGAKALADLRVAAEGAAVGNSDLEDTSRAMVGALMVQMKGTQGVNQVMGMENAIIGHGVMRMNDMNAALITGILPSAKMAGLSFLDVGAALDTMTSRSFPASRAATGLRMTLAKLSAPSPSITAMLKSLGMGQLQMARDLLKPRGLLVALTDLHKHLRDSARSCARWTSRPSSAVGVTPPRPRP